MITLLILLTISVSAATLYGNVYDFSLNEVTDAIVEINSTPKQVMVSKQGTYSFNLPKGSFLITAIRDDEIVEETVSVTQEGEYVLDLILLEDFSVEMELLKNVDQDIIVEEPKYNNNNNTAWLVFIVVMIIGPSIILFLFAVRRKKKKEQCFSDDLQPLINIIDKNKRIPQKEIYKSLPWSESKISLMLDELESKGYIERIKKGRSNVVLKK